MFIFFVMLLACHEYHEGEEMHHNSFFSFPRGTCECQRTDETKAQNSISAQQFDFNVEESNILLFLE